MVVMVTLVAVVSTRAVTMSGVRRRCPWSGGDGGASGKEEAVEAAGAEGRPRVGTGQTLSVTADAEGHPVAGSRHAR